MEFVRREATDADEVRAELDVIGRVIAKALGGGFAVVEVQCPVKPQWLTWDEAADGGTGQARDQQPAPGQ